MAIEIGYEGWFQCRLATDRDAYDEPRGRFGWTFAFANEPDLDRIIRFHKPVSLRSHAPVVKVSVTSVAVDGAAIGDSPLIGAPVDLLDNAVFEGRNGEIAISAEEPVVPFHIQITQGSFRVQRFDPVDLNDFADLLRRQPVGASANDPELLAATGISDPVAFREARLGTLRDDRQNTADPDLQQQLDGRIRELVRTQGFASTPQVRTLVFRLDYAHELTGASEIEDPDGLLPAAVDPDQAWRIRYFMGGWDADTLCGFTRGTLLLP